MKFGGQRLLLARINCKNKSSAKRPKNSQKLTVVHNAILEAIAPGGIFNVIWDKVPSPNMRNPMIATLPYIKTHKEKLYPKKRVQESGKIKTSNMLCFVLPVKEKLLGIIVPCYEGFGKLFLVSHGLINVWENRMSCKAKSIDTNGKWNAIPLYQLTSVMESNTFCGPNKNHTDNNQNCCNNPSSCRSYYKFQ